MTNSYGQNYTEYSIRETENYENHSSKHAQIQNNNQIRDLPNREISNSTPTQSEYNTQNSNDSRNEVRNINMNMNRQSSYSPTNHNYSNNHTSYRPRNSSTDAIDTYRSSPNFNQNSHQNHESQINHQNSNQNPQMYRQTSQNSRHHNHHSHSSSGYQSQKSNYAKYTEKKVKQHLNYYRNQNYGRANYTFNDYRTYAPENTCSQNSHNQNNQPGTYAQNSMNFRNNFPSLPSQRKKSSVDLLFEDDDEPTQKNFVPNSNSNINNFTAENNVFSGQNQASVNSNQNMNLPPGFNHNELIINRTANFNLSSMNNRNNINNNNNILTNSNFLQDIYNRNNNSNQFNYDIRNPSTPKYYGYSHEVYTRTILDKTSKDIKNSGRQLWYRHIFSLNTDLSIHDNELTKHQKNCLDRFMIKCVENDTQGAMNIIFKLIDDEAFSAYNNDCY
jgi:hypothetical protein